MISRVVMLSCVKEEVESDVRDALNECVKGGVEVECGLDNSSEGLDHGLNFVTVVTLNNNNDNNDNQAESIKKIQDELIRITEQYKKGDTTKYIMIRFTGEKTDAKLLDSSTTNSSSTPIRHLVIWAFAADCSTESINKAIEGYRKMPNELHYFSDLETGRGSIVNLGVGMDEKWSKANLVALYSTFLGKDQQHQFVEDDRRKAFKAKFVAPHLYDNKSVIVLDFQCSSRKLDCPKV